MKILSLPDFKIKPVLFPYFYVALHVNFLRQKGPRLPIFLNVLKKKQLERRREVLIVSPFIVARMLIALKEILTQSTSLACNAIAPIGIPLKINNPTGTNNLRSNHTAKVPP